MRKNRKLWFIPKRNKKREINDNQTKIILLLPIKHTYCVTPVIWHCGKGKAMETVKGQRLPGAGGRRNGWEERGFSGQWKYSVASLATCFCGSAVKNLPAHAGDTGSIPGLGRSCREGNGNPLQYSCLGNRMDRGVWGYSLSGPNQPRGLSGLQSMGSQKNRAWLSD